MATIEEDMDRLKTMEEEYRQMSISLKAVEIRLDRMKEDMDRGLLELRDIMSKGILEAYAREIQAAEAGDTEAKETHDA